MALRDVIASWRVIALERCMTSSHHGVVSWRWSAARCHCVMALHRCPGALHDVIAAQRCVIALGLCVVSSQRCVTTPQR